MTKDDKYGIGWSATEVQAFVNPNLTDEEIKQFEISSSLKGGKPMKEPNPPIEGYCTNCGVQFTSSSAASGMCNECRNIAVGKALGEESFPVSGIKPSPAPVKMYEHLLLGYPRDILEELNSLYLETHGDAFVPDSVSKVIRIIQMIEAHRYPATFILFGKDAFQMLIDSGGGLAYICEEHKVIVSGALKTGLLLGRPYVVLEGRPLWLPTHQFRIL